MVGAIIVAFFVVRWWLNFVTFWAKKSHPEPPLFYRSNSDKIMTSDAPNKPNHSCDMGDNCDGVGWPSANSTNQNPTISLHHDAKSILIQNVTNQCLLKTGTALHPHLNSDRMETWKPIPRCSGSIGPLWSVSGLVAPKIFHGYSWGSAKKNDVGSFVLFSTYFN